MAATLESPLLANKAAAAGGSLEIEKSLRFNTPDTARLDFTPARNGNRRVWTYSTWVKLGDVSSGSNTNRLWAANGPTNPSSNLGTNGRLHFQRGVDGKLACGDGNSNYFFTNALYKDPSAWYHVVFAVDMTRLETNERMSIWVNGELVAWNGYNAGPLAQNTQLAINKAETQMNIGVGENQYGDQYLADTYFIDGLQLNPAAFGSFDSKGVWNPKAFAIPKPNNGTTWSSTVTTGGASLKTSDHTPSAGIATNMFNADGVEYGTWTDGPDNATSIVTWKPPSDITADCSIRIGFLRVEWESAVNFTINGEDLTDDLFTQIGLAMDGSQQTNTWYTAPSRTITAAQGITWQRCSNSKEIIVSAIEVDGVLLRDGITDVSTRNNINDGRTWSSYWTATTGTVDGTDGFTNSFDGSVSTATKASNSSQLKWVPDTTITAERQIDVFMYIQGDVTGQSEFKVNNVSKWAAAKAELGYGSVGWYSIGKTIDSTNGILIGRHNNDNDCWIYAIRVDGHILLDGAVDNSFHLKYNDTSLNRYLGKDTLNGAVNKTGAAPSGEGAYPFYDTTDDYGDVKDSGTRTDSNSGNLVFAMPGTTLTDVSASPHTMTNSGVTVSTAQSRFYGSSLYFNSDHLSAPYHADFLNGYNGNFTIEAWVKTTASSKCIMAVWDGGNSKKSWNMYIGGSGPVLITSVDGSNQVDIAQSSVKCHTGNWCHVAFVRNSNTVKCYVNGVETGSSSFSGTLYDTTNSIFAIGATNGTAEHFDGYIQDARIYKAAKYTANFKPPTRNDFTPVNLIADAHGTTYDASGTWTGGAVTKNGDGMFNGITDSGYYQPNSNSASSDWAPATAISGTTFKLYTTHGDDNLLKVNNTAVQTVHNGWTDISSAANGSLTSIKLGPSGLGSTWVRAWALEVDGVMITNQPHSDTDSFTDTPTNYGDDDRAGGEVRGNYCTWNPLNNSNTLSEGNLTTTTADSTNNQACSGTLAFTSGKWYFEITIGAKHSNGYPLIGIAETDKGTGNNTGQSNAFSYYSATGTTKSGTSYTAASVGDVIGVAVDADNGRIYYALNNTWQNSGDPTNSAATGAEQTWTAGEKTFVPWVSEHNSSKSHANFGQRAFKYTGPSGYECLCTQNLSDLFSGAALNDPSKYFDVKTWYGNGATGTNKVSLNFQPDYVWIKGRDTTWYHQNIDAVRGKNNAYYANATDVENTSASDRIDSWSSTGITLGNSVGVNQDTKKYVGWFWDAGTAAVENPSSSYNITPSGQWVNTTSGFSITGYTGNGSDDQTLPHGLNAVPDFVIIKNRDNNAGSWIVKHSSLTSGKVLFLDNTNAEGDSSYGEIKDLDSNVTVTLDDTGNDAANVNKNTEKYVMYAWTSIPGFSKFSSYEGNGNANGPFVHLGFRPALIIYKHTGTDNWTILDAERSLYNGHNPAMQPDTTSAEWEDANFRHDFLSNGFKLRSSHAQSNSDGVKYIYAAWAESPLKTVRAR